MMNLAEEPTQTKPAMPEPTQQPILQPPKRKLNKKVISIILIAIVSCSSLGTLGYFYWDLNNRFNGLQSEYATLQGIHSQLSADYQTLQQNYRNVNSEYENLNSRYNDLYVQYQSLFSQNNALSHVFDEPLQNKTVPTIEELQQWLSEDKTDEIQYDYPNFICGDFSVMLSQHAKLKNWDMGIVTVYGYNENHESYGHAFNAIITAEGLRYVESQNDYFWHYSDGKEIQVNRWNEIGIDREWIYVEEYKTIIRFD